MSRDLKEGFELTPIMQAEIMNFKNSFFRKHGFIPPIQCVYRNEKGKLKPSITDIYRIIEGLFQQAFPGLAADGIKTKTRDKRVIAYRQSFFKTCMDFNYGSSELGRFLSNFDHATVLHSRTSVNNLLDTHDSFYCKINIDIQRELQLITLKDEGKLHKKINIMAKQYAIACHEEVNQLYDIYPYEHHLKMVVDVAIKFIDLIPEEDRDIVISGCWVHDVIEDCRQTYNDVKASTNEIVAEFAYALANIKGKTRKERSGNAYYEGIKNLTHCAFIKCCDRIANVEYSIQTNSNMLKKYEQENKEFVDKLCVHEYWQIFDYLTNLF